ncbi:MAG: hypothetical protein PVH29_12290 [Candidatus Zixiibacteriota bacterium]
MRRLIFTTVLCATAVAAVSAETEYDYPPEFADLVAGSRLLTPEEVLIDVAVHADTPWHEYAGALLLEPVLVKSFNGTPAYYMIIGYVGDDKTARDEMESITKLLNNKEGFDPYDLAKRITSIESAWGDFYTFFRPAWNTGIGIRMSVNYAPKILMNFTDFLNQVESYAEITKTGDFKILASDFHVGKPVLYYSDSEGGPRYFLVEMMTEVKPVDEMELDRNFSEWVSQTEDWFDKRPEYIPAEIDFWNDILTDKNEVEKEGKYYKVREREEYEDDEIDDWDVENVPDFNQNGAPHDQGSPDCWAWSMVSNLVYYSQKRGMVWENYKNPQGKNETPEFDTGQSWGSDTWHFADFVYYRLYLAATYEGLGGKYQSGAKEDCTVFCADGCTEREGWKGLNNEPKWKYWLGSALYGSEYHDNDIECTLSNLSYSEIQGKINGNNPLSTHWFDYPTYGQHAVPTWGWYMDGDHKMLSTWDLHPPAYVEVPYVEHPETNPGGVPIAGLHCKPPQGAGTDPWVCDFEINKKWGRAELTWDVSTSWDVKGFNLYREDTRGNLHRLNDEIIRHDREDEFSYNYTDEDFEKDRPYVLEVVRYTPDDVKTLIYQRELIR